MMDEAVDAEMSDEEISAGLRALTEEEFARLLGRLAGWEVPRVFAVYEVAPDRSDVRAFGWGLAFETRAFFVGCLGEKSAYMSLSSAAQVVTMFGRRRELRLLWPVPNADRTAEAPWPADEERQFAEID
ncbi:MAG: hypothetical protein WCA46_02110 [Actinocatenispora sp.]